MFMRRWRSGKGPKCEQTNSKSGWETSKLWMRCVSEPIELWRPSTGTSRSKMICRFEVGGWSSRWYSRLEAGSNRRPTARRDTSSAWTSRRKCRSYPPGVRTKGGGSLGGARATRAASPFCSSASGVGTAVGCTQPEAKRSNSCSRSASSGKPVSSQPDGSRNVGSPPAVAGEVQSAATGEASPVAGAASASAMASGCASSSGFGMRSKKRARIFKHSMRTYISLGIASPLSSSSCSS
mmetsp:Transcript_112011/g.241524  ORF Transcript_112011/g.241524 Transcript_112011/m.241524 type:complete len:238 (-) Transcript_112011:830-1543(-)